MSYGKYARTVAAFSGCLFVSAAAVGHDHPSHENDQLPPYEGPGYTFGGGSASIEFPANGVHLLSWIPVLEFGAHTSANDCWGYTSPSGREYAIIGLSNGTGFVEISNPAEPDIIAVIPGPQSQWRDIKTYQTYAYAVSEGGGGIQVIDMGEIDAGVVTLVGSVTEGGSLPTLSTHNVVIDEESGYLYRCGGGGGTIGLRIYSLADPALPAFVGQWHDRYVHDAQVVLYDSGPFAGREIAFLYSNNNSGGGNPGLDILDVTDKADIQHLGFSSYSFTGFSHQGWLSEDRTLVYLNDELAEINFGIPTTTRVIDVSDLTNPFEASTYTNGSTSIGHNIYIRDHLIFAANYRSGLRIFDASADPLAPIEVAFFDTFPENDNANFNGLWSNYPYFPSTVVIGSDIEKGLFVWWVGDLPLAFDYPEGLPDLLNPAGDSIRVAITPTEGNGIVPGSQMLTYETATGVESVPLVHAGGEEYEATLPAMTCGEPVAWYVTAESTSGLVMRDPQTAPTHTYTSIAGVEADELFADEFDADLGWTVGAPDDDATAGIWERADPVGTSSGGQQAQPDAPFVGSACYITGQHPGGGAGANDVDHGKTTLFSPILDLAGAEEVIISYWRWYSNHAGANPGVDVFEVDISDDGGKSWVNVETVGPTGPETMGGWYRNEFSVSNLVNLTSTVQVRFVASDYDPQALVEAAIDAFHVQQISCFTCPGDLTGDGVVGVSDLLALLSDWGSCDGCIADLNNDGVVDVSDMLTLLSAWGACP